MRKQGRMNQIPTWFEGKKTYLTCLVAGALLFGSWQGWWRLPAEIYAGLATLATACLRAGISRELGRVEVQDTPSTSGNGGPATPGSPPPAGPGAKGAVQALVIAAGLGMTVLTGCGTLDPAGVYHGDKLLYTADVTLADAYDALHGFVQWEYANRAALASQPAIRESADRVRAEAPQWFASALAVRDAYAAAPTTANQSALASALAVIQAAVTQAAAWQAGAPPSAKAPSVPSVR